MLPKKYLSLPITLLAIAVVAGVSAGLVFLTIPFGDPEPALAVVSSRSLDGRHLTQVKIRSSLHAKALSDIIQPHLKDLQHIADSITPQQAADEIHIRSIRRRILETLGPESRIIEIRVNVLPVPRKDPLLEDLIRRLPGTLGYTND